MIIFADLHLREESESVVLGTILPMLHEAAKQDEDRTLVCLGDFWHLRYLIPVYLQIAVCDFCKKLHADQIKFLLLPGNHDQINPAGNNALEVYDAFPHVTVYNGVTWTKDGLWVPYRKDPQTLRAAVLWPAPAGAISVLWTHHGVKGARMNNQRVDTEGVDAAALGGFQHIITGHYHLPQRVGRVTYVGSPYQINAGEAGQVKGFGIFNRRTLEFKFQPISVGKQFHFFEAHDPAGMDLTRVRRGDEVRITTPAGADSAEFVRALEGAGVSVVVTPAVEERGDRLAVGPGAAITEYAQAYVREFSKDLDPARLMAIFQAVTHANRAN